MESTEENDPLSKGVVTFMSWMLMAAGISFATLFALDPAIPTQRVVLNLTVAVIGLITLLMVRSGHERLAAQLTIWVMFAIITVSVWRNGGMQAPNILNYLVLIVVSGWLLGTRLTQLLFGLIALALISIYIADTNGLLPVLGEPKPLAHLAYILFILFLTTALTLISRRSYSSRLEEVKQAANKLAAQEFELLKLSRAVEQSPDSILITDAEARIEYVNEAFVKHTGYSRAEVYGQNPRILQSRNTPPEVFADLWASLTSGRAWHGEFRNRRKDGTEIFESASISPIRQSDGTITHYVAIEEDMTQARLAEEKIHHLTNFDYLTGLPNQTQLIKRLDLTLGVATHQSRHAALILLNIDRFKNFNDANGRAPGDALLTAFGKRLAALLHEGDIVARFSSDEFAILPHELGIHAEQASRRAMFIVKEVQNALRTPFKLGDDSEVTITASLGVTLFPENGKDSVQDILRRADIALHRAKSAGGSQVSYFDTAMTQSAEQRFRIESELRSGIANGELRIFLQPQVDPDGTRVGAEVLVRWQHPERGLLSPMEFIPIAEESDLIVDLGIWVMTEACRLIAREEKAGSPLELSVNISPRHFHRIEFVSWLKLLLASAGADPCRLTLEITESIVINDVNEAIGKMVELTSHGIHFSIDDFGTGYSSLAYLKMLPIHELKIDKTFIHDVPGDADDVALVETIFAVAKHMRLRVVAEGVETEAQARFLNSCGAVIHQGYLFGRPEEAAVWIARWHHNIAN